MVISNFPKREVWQLFKPQPCENAKCASEFQLHFATKVALNICYFSLVYVKDTHLKGYIITRSLCLAKWVNILLITFENIFDALKIVDLCLKIFMVVWKFLWKRRNFVWLHRNIYDCAEILYGCAEIFVIVHNFIFVPTNTLLLPRFFFVARNFFCCPKNILLPLRIYFGFFVPN